MQLKNVGYCINVLIVILVFLQDGDSHRILTVMPFSSTSHKNTLVPLISALAERGHQLVFITRSKTEQLQNNHKVTEIVVNLEIKN